MSDRELLEMAAKAAGIEGISFDRARRDWGWNPLDDDGDAFRLAVKLGMSLVVGCHGFKGKTSWTRCQMVERSEYHNDDPCAATRRAIVRAAAEIGKGME